MWRRFLQLQTVNSLMKSNSLLLNSPPSSLSWKESSEQCSHTRYPPGGAVDLSIPSRERAGCAVAGSPLFRAGVGGT